ncbi:helix-turn-helix domain-containing protein [Elizabethkingia ursingii]|uniref:helix-turn-helix domain-containing protein n=1 Tax=Elizabethkingia ursingii TaxID=1756150 RepID=UPI0020111DA9|nr:helix-turn-helix domain-containing protein [Elizabethkingia ursingii]MCL1666569.1 helix-turn-helix domain-containing protein [Elizabethkingia ursingii]
MEILSKQDLEIFRIRILADIERLLVGNLNQSKDEFDWLRSKAIRKMMDISPATLQNLRITGKIRHKKILGSYYYNKTDLQKLFEDEN